MWLFGMVVKSKFRIHKKLGTNFVSRKHENLSLIAKHINSINRLEKTTKSALKFAQIIYLTFMYITLKKPVFEGNFLRRS